MKEVENLQRKFKELFDEMGREGEDEVLAHQPVQRLESFYTGIKFALDELGGEEDVWGKGAEIVLNIGKAAGAVGGAAIGLQYKMQAAREIAHDIVYSVFEKMYGSAALHNSEAIEAMNKIADEATRIPYGAIGVAVGALAGAFSAALGYYLLASDFERRRKIRDLTGIYVKTEFLIKRKRES
ncbi:MAG TPA: hypothetical protein VJB06_01465 [archaeon]|nr:hypothetical protein [archaeon]